ncbi:PLP-dependent transferase [Xylaria bambusicola]|uniref:PLP-dependent transferase n=1 Tax=Xylaria bambusicola TaxID=326684 RepID=UPI0020083BDC|nr:PLP-dependent transferase [Xylaria bambusicola]KAI0521557.1 PLP-dependent transferase [Xylaria bambusicola]
MPIKTLDFLDESFLDHAAVNHGRPSITPSIYTKAVRSAFEKSKARWIDDPTISQWRNPCHKIYDVLAEVDGLYEEWASSDAAPFQLSPDPLWLDTGRILASVGLPWHNNQINLPSEIDTSWPFHFKRFEAQLIKIKAARVGNFNPSGYVSNYDEANLYCIRALQHDFRELFPTQRPILAYDRFDTELIWFAERAFGLEGRQLSLCRPLQVLEDELLTATCNATRPIIFAATLCNLSSSEYDDISVISQLSRRFRLFLHVDAFRSFDYVTVGPDHGQHPPEKLTLAAIDSKEPVRMKNGSICASTIVAGGMNHSRYDPAVALKPASVGGQRLTRVAYVRGFDSTLSGSRDAITPLWLALYEERLGDRGFQELLQYHSSLRSLVLHRLRDLGIPAVSSPYCTDIIITSYTRSQKQWLVMLGGKTTPKGTIVLSINPYSSTIKLLSFLPEQVRNPVCFKDFAAMYPLSQKTLVELEATVRSWQIVSRSMTGYPVYLGSHSALGPVVGLLYDVNICNDWAERKSRELLDHRMGAFGLISSENKKHFKGTFTNGSTMGNRHGIMNALVQFPNAFIYCSTETHYSVLKTLRDCDTLTNRWVGGEPRYSQINSAPNGSILVEALVQQAVTDRYQCVAEGVEYHMILLVNMGTTFVGARDNLAEAFRELRRVGIQISYIHVDGALDFGYETCGMKLGPPGAVDNDCTPLVQGITLSHHKALGTTVSGEVLYFSPENQRPIPCLSIHPRVIFEVWFYSQVYSAADRSSMFSYCRENSSLLQTGLERMGIVTKRNYYSIITVFERPLAWITEQFCLRPEGDWVHFITMPHISKETVERFLDQVLYTNKQVSAALRCISPLLSNTFTREMGLKRIQCCSVLAERVSTLIRPVIRFHDIRYRDTGSTLDIKLNLRGALSIVAVDGWDEIQLVFLLGSDRAQSIHVGPIFVKNQFDFCKTNIIEILTLLVCLLARYLKADISVDSQSYRVYTF